MGTTDYLSRNPDKSDIGETDDRIFTIMLVNDLNERKNLIVKSRILGKLMTYEKKTETKK